MGFHFLSITLSLWVCIYSGVVGFGFGFGCIGWMDWEGYGWRWATTVSGRDALLVFIMSVNLGIEGVFGRKGSKGARN